MLTSRTEANNLINAIVSNYSHNFLYELPQNCIKLTKHLFAHQYLLYSDLNHSFETSGVVIALIMSLDRIDEQQKRDVLRLIHLLLQVNRQLRDIARQNDDFQLFLKRTLDSDACWSNGAKYKHHINIASLLLSDKDKVGCSFNKSSVRAMAIQKIEAAIEKSLPGNEDILSYIVFYSCAMFTGKFEDIQTSSEDEQLAMRILSKELIGRCLDILRDYVQDFKLFYAEEDRTGYILYKAKSEYCFQQISSVIIYHSVQSKKLRLNVSQSGLYTIINNLFSLAEIHETILFSGIDVLKIAILDDSILLVVKNEFMKPFTDKLNNQLKRETLSTSIKIAISSVLKSFDMKTSLKKDEEMSTSSNDTLRVPTGEFVQCSKKQHEIVPSDYTTNISMLEVSRSNSFGFEQWSHADVLKWLVDNKLDDLKEMFTYLTGCGLKQLQELTKQSDKMKLIEFFMGVMRIRFDMCLELISALEKL